MKRVLLILSACLLFAAAEARKPEGAHLALEHPTHDFGDVPRKGGDLVHEFRFTNDGTAPLVILRAMTSCSCPEDFVSEAARGAGRFGRDPRRL